MKKALILLTAMILLLFASASCETAGNLNNGSFLIHEGNSLYIARPDGIWKTDENGANGIKITNGPASMLQMYEGRLYYLSDLYGEDLFGNPSLIAQTPMTCLPDGSDARAIGPEKAVGEIYEYPDKPGSPRRIDLFIGYKCFTVYNGNIYYLANSQEGGSYTCTDTLYDDDGSAEVYSSEGTYRFGISLYKMDLNGENTQKLTGVIGNSIASMAIADDQIYLAGGFADTIYAYNFVNYRILTLSGEPISVFINAIPTDITLASEAGQFYHITNALIPDGESMLVSLSDSEGDFVASRFSRLYADGTTDLIALEHGFVPSVLSGTTVYYIGSASDTVFYDDEAVYIDTYGIYRKDIAEEGKGMRIAALPYGSGIYDTALLKAGDYVYCLLRSGELHRVHTETGEHTVYTENGFA